MFIVQFLSTHISAICPTVIRRSLQPISPCLLKQNIWRAMSLLETARRGPNFDNLALRMLPVNHEGNEVRIVSNACFARVKPTPVRLPKMVLASYEALQLLDLPTELLKRCPQCTDAHDEFVQYLSGNKVWPGSEPSAHCYCGHQFGSFAGQLGDGAVM